MTFVHTTAPPSVLPPSPRARIRRRLAMLLAGLLTTCSFLLAGLAVEAVPARAAATVGVGGYWTPAGGWLGNYIAGGKRVYCIDVLTDTAGSGGTGRVTNRIDEAGHGTRPVSGNELRMINYAVSTWGQTADPVTASAVAAYVYNFTSANWTGRGEHYIGGPYESAILAKYLQVKADVAANYRRSAGSGTGQLQLDIDESSHYLGTLRVSGLSPANAVGTVSLENGVFADTGLPTRDGVTNNSSFAVLGVPPQDGNDYRVRAFAAFRGSGPTSYSSNVTVFAEGSMQRTVGPGQSAPSSVSFELTAEDEHDRTARFRPIVGTRVAAKFVEAGEEFVDLLTFTTEPTGELQNPWYRGSDGGFARVKAVGTLYGPFLSQPDESDTVPENAPVAAEGVEVITSAELGPDSEYRAPSGVLAEEAGYYTWVWSINQADQPDATRALLPEGYAFQDRFGQVVETSITPTRLHISTQLTAATAGIGQSVVDDVTVQPLGGGWLQVGGARVPAHLVGTVYFSEQQPELSEQAPQEAEVIATHRLTLNGPGTAPSEAIRLPLKAGFVTVQWCLRESDQPEWYRGLIADTCDMYGQSSETVQVRVPEVRTEAKPTAVPGETVFDTAIVTGEVAAGMALEFSLYKQPVVGDEKRGAEAQSGSIWTATEVDELGTEPYCGEANLIDTGELIGVEEGTHDGSRHDSEEVRVDEAGTYWWIERLVHVDPDTDEQTVVHEGACGLPNETSIVEYPPVPEAPKESLAETGAAHDGQLPIRVTLGLLIGLAAVLIGLGTARSMRR